MTTVNIVTLHIETLLLGASVSLFHFVRVHTYTRRRTHICIHVYIRVYTVYSHNNTIGLKCARPDRCRHCQSVVASRTCLGDVTSGKTGVETNESPGSGERETRGSTARTMDECMYSRSSAPRVFVVSSRREIKRVMDKYIYIYINRDADDDDNNKNNMFYLLNV